MEYFRPIAMTDAARPDDALPLAGGWCWFDRAEVICRRGSRGVIPASDLPKDVATRLSAPRVPIDGLDPARPRIMGVLNVTPDSFSDGGRYDALDAALTQARAIAASGGEMLDIGGESTRPGAVAVSSDEEISRTVPVIRALVAEGYPLPISIDTRKAVVADAAMRAGASIINDVSALGFDPAMATVAEECDARLCLMHAQGTPETMQIAPEYENVLLDVYDFLAERLQKAEAAGIDRRRVILDPGIGFGKDQEHNLTLLSSLSIFHGLGCTLMLGVSRKRFIGVIGGGAVPEGRLPGTLAVTLAGIAQGVQVHRVHDVAEIRQGMRLWQAVTLGASA